MQAGARQLRQRVAGRVRRELKEAVGLTNYRLKQRFHAPQLPELSPLGRHIVDEANQTGVSVVHLDDLSLRSNAALKKVMPRAVADLDAMAQDGSHVEQMDYAEGFAHCVPLNPKHVAKTYPELYLWGLDEGVLDIVENLIGLPVAYHGVVTRKELVDGEFTGSRRWHRDMEDRNIIRISLYLTDVLDLDSGPFEYVPLALSPPDRKFKGFEGRIDSDVMRGIVPESQWRQCIGPAGTLIFGAVAQIYHHGRVPKRPRCAASFYYTSREPTEEVLCRENSFQTGMPYIDPTGLTQRQRECLWHYSELLPR